MPNVPEEWGNNFYKSGWQPGLEVNEQTGLGNNSCWNRPRL